MDLLKTASDWLLPRSFLGSGPAPEQVVLSTKKTAVSALCAAAAAACLHPASDAPSELPYYGRSPPVYPSPITNGTTSPSWSAAYHRAHALVSNMTVAEKANLTRGFPSASTSDGGGGGPCVGNTGGVPRLGIPPLCFYDGPSGLRGHEFASAFPAGVHLAATFDRELMYAYGRAVGSEFYGKGVNFALGPVAGPLGRVAKGGRNWEGLGSDPFLAGVGMGRVTQGMQDAGVVATAKHWVLNEQEERRRWVEGVGDAVSANVGDRVLHEVYVWPFMDALRAGVGAVMCSYQRANHSYACQNSKLLNGVLKGELGFEGFVVSDWDGQMSGVASANAGLDMVMPGAGFWGERLIEAVNNGSVNEERLNDMATRILASWHYLHQEHSFPEPALYTNTERHLPADVQADHAELIKTIGATGTVLLKNTHQTLPLKKPRFLCVFGYDATVHPTPWDNRDRYGGGYDVNFGWATFNGTLITGGGSGGSTPPYVVSPFQAIQQRIAKDRGVLRWDFWSKDPTPYVNAEACLVFINAYASESFDRTSLSDEFSDKLVLNVASWCERTIVVVHSAGIRLVDPWISHPNITAVLFAGLPGQESGHSLTSILYGDVSPSGRLPYTIARSESDYGHLLNPTISSDPFPESNFTEGVFIDYRYFDKHGVEPRFEFGFGLSYTTFGYGGLSAEAVAFADLAEYPDKNVPIGQGGHPALWEVVAVVKCTVTNTGDVNGAEIAQLYVGIPGENSPMRQLRGFVKVGPLVPGQRRQAVFELTRRDLSVWDVVAQQWRLQRGKYKLWVGASSRDLRLEGSLVVQ
ncbi:hypothetical protein VTI74DRAFT_10608 [Chaetomium olivicolor]